ncbi:DUF1552 domain-containing protein [Stieleria varia]|uniref:Secreted protein containing DUF1552 n=1 Tax=Stieleria varia TaxID=2528005 RepID=A0A5C6AN10_9BACT|nr:DUF1552 domain-containing protein [Stieleria varia]TWU00867.1 hypothetical protein Pla52n_42360 [Stieleria varia]
MNSKSLGRRSLLRGVGVALALPALESMPRAIAAETSEAIANRPTKRMVCIGNMLGFYPEAFWPEGAGAEYQLSQTTQALEVHRDQLTIVGGLDHGLKGGHFSIHAFLSGVRSIDAKSMPEGNITIDQRAAETVGGQTRFPSLTIGSESGIHGGCQMSWTRSGTRVPPIPGPRELFQKLFVGVSEQDKQREADRFRLQESILDNVLGDANALSRKLNKRDQRKLDEYLSSVRDVERKLDLSKQWVDIDKPEPPIAEPQNTNMVQDLPLLYDLIALALQTDSTRVATLELGGSFETRDFGIKGGYHGLSHHGQRQESIDALIKIETYQVEQYARFLSKLRALEVGGESLLDQTMVLFGSGMGNANSHTNTNLPVVLAGGGFRHGQMIRYEKSDKHRPPLANLFVSMLQQFGLEIDQFATSTGTLSGFEAKV